LKIFTLTVRQNGKVKDSCCWNHIRRRLAHPESRPRRSHQTGTPITNIQLRTTLTYIPQICQYIETRRSYIDFIGDHVDSRLADHKKLNKLCQDYQLYSPNLDGSVQEILEKVEDMAEVDTEFFAQLSKREKDEIQTLVAQCKEIFELLLELRRKELE
jgi:hypothetical protein